MITNKFSQNSIEKQKAPNNRTIELSDEERAIYLKQIFRIHKKCTPDELENVIIQQNMFEVIDLLPKGFVDLLIIDPPYNLSKNYNGYHFSQTTDEVYAGYLQSWMPKIIQTLKPDGSIYVCCDWKSSSAVYGVLSQYTTIMNRITWQRDKGRGAQSNWKNCMEDIWFGVMDPKAYYFDVEAVKQKRRVKAPYKEKGIPKDWEATADGNFRLTHPSNFWDDISIPYWSMAENTKHSEQKPEKLMAKLILASSPRHGFVFDPFVGSGTTAVVAKKLGRKFLGIEMNEEYACLGLKRLHLAESNKEIQGYSGGVFWERNSLTEQKKCARKQKQIEISQY